MGKDDKNNKKEKKALNHLTGILERLSKKEEKEMDSLEKKLLEERGFLKYFLWISESFNKVGRTVKIISIGTLVLVLGMLGFYIVDRGKIGTYEYMPNKTIIKSRSYLMEIKDQKTLNELMVHPSVYMSERLAIGNYIERNSRGELIAHTDGSIKRIFKELVNYDGSESVVLGFNFKAEKYTIGNPMLCDLVETGSKIDLALNSPDFPNNQKGDLSIGACIVKVEEGNYVVYPKELFDSGSFTFVVD